MASIHELSRRSRPTVTPASRPRRNTPPLPTEIPTRPLFETGIPSNVGTMIGPAAPVAGAARFAAQTEGLFNTPEASGTVAPSFARFAAGQMPQTAPSRPADLSGLVAPQIDEKLLAAESQLEIQEQLKNAPLPFAAREALEQQRIQTQSELDQIAQDLERLAATESSIQENFDFGSALLEAQGLPATVQSAREDPTVAAAIEKVDAAIQAGDSDSLDAAIDAMASLGEDTLSNVSEAYGRDAYLAELQMNIKNEMHNLVQNRQNIDQNLIEYEDWLEKEAQAQELNLWDFQGDPSPVGRGFDTIINDVQPWLEQNFNGIMTQDQELMVAEALNNIWQNSLSDQPIEILDEEGQPTGEFEDRPDVSAEIEQGLLQLATVGSTDSQGNPIPGLGFTQAQAIQFIDKIKAAVERGRTVTDEVDAWKTSEFLEPGGAGLGAAIYETAEELYEDPEVAEQMAKSDFLHRLIMMRSGGDVNFTGGGNQFGLGALPEHTYEQMGYEIAELQGNPELQMEALLTYIGYWQYGTGYEGLQAAVQDMMHNPNTWGDISSG